MLASRLGMCGDFLLARLACLERKGSTCSDHEGAKLLTAALGQQSDLLETKVPGSTPSGEDWSFVSFFFG